MPKSYLLLIITFGFLCLAVGQSGPGGVEGPKLNVAFFANDEHGKPVSDIASSDLVALNNRRPPIRVLE